MPLTTNDPEPLHPRASDLTTRADWEERATQATPKAELERQIMSWNVPKNEREWWALHEIERLREIVRLKRPHPVYGLAILMVVIAALILFRFWQG
jgi:hypothetical protein